MLTINDTAITKDDEGRYSLNDLHLSSGGDKRFLPNKFFRLESVKSVIEILMRQNSTVNPISKKSGRYGGGTWVCKELVYKYAMWVSAEFEVKVIQTFDAMVQINNNSSSMVALSELTKKIEGDKELASRCGQLLAEYKEKKKKNDKEWMKAVSDAQMVLGIN